MSFHKIRELIVTEEIFLKKVHTSKNASDMLTKWVFLECLCVTIVISLFYSETFSVTACERKHIAEPREFSVYFSSLF